MAFQPDAHLMDYIGKKTRVDRYSSKGKEGILGGADNPENISYWAQWCCPRVPALPETPEEYEFKARLGNT